MRNFGKRILRSKSFWIFVVLILIAGIYVGSVSGIIPNDFPNWLFYEKPVWSWLELIILPAAIFSGFYLLNLGIRRTTNTNFKVRLGFDKRIAQIKVKNDRKNNQETIQTNLKISELHRYDDILNTYLEIIMGLINEKNLLSSLPEDSIRQSARMHTIIALSRMNNGQNQHIIEAIRSTGLINPKDPIISLRNANFRRGSFREVNFSGLDLEYVNMVESNLEIANLSFTNMKGGNFRNSSMGGVNIKLADLQEAKLWWSDLQLSTMFRSNLYRAQMSFSDLSQSTIIECYMVEANLEKAILEKAILKGSILRGANLNGANLREANLRGADLDHANLRDSNLSGAVLYKTTLRSADLTGANLSFANIQGANFHNAIMPDGSRFTPLTNPNKFTQA